jgi:hypothetical protein
MKAASAFNRPLSADSQLFLTSFSDAGRSLEQVNDERRTAMPRRLSGVIAVLAVGGALAGGAVAYAASSTSTTPSNPSSAPSDSSPAPAYGPAPAASHDQGDCPGMGGDSSGSGSSDGSAAPGGSSDSAAPGGSSGSGYGV